MATIVACVVAVAGAAKKSSDERRAANAASTQAMATHASNQSALIARAYNQSMQATAASYTNPFDAARVGLTPGPGAGSGGGMGGGGLGNAAVMGTATGEGPRS